MKNREAVLDLRGSYDLRWRTTRAWMVATASFAFSWLRSFEAQWHASILGPAADHHPPACVTLVDRRVVPVPGSVDVRGAEVADRVVPGDGFRLCLGRIAMATTTELVPDYLDVTKLALTRELTLIACTQDLKAFLGWCQRSHDPLLLVTRGQLQLYLRHLSSPSGAILSKPSLVSTCRF